MASYELKSNEVIFTLTPNASRTHVATKQKQISILDEDFYQEQKICKNKVFTQSFTSIFIDES